MSPVCQRGRRSPSRSSHSEHVGGSRSSGSKLHVSRGYFSIASSIRCLFLDRTGARSLWFLFRSDLAAGDDFSYSVTMNVRSPIGFAFTTGELPRIHRISVSVVVQKEADGSLTVRVWDAFGQEDEDFGVMSLTGA